MLIWKLASPIFILSDRPIPSRISQKENCSEAPSEGGSAIVVSTEPLPRYNDQNTTGPRNWLTRIQDPGRLEFLVYVVSGSTCRQNLGQAVGSHSLGSASVLRKCICLLLS